ncbi:MAG: hypothetical protein GEU81_06470 [Nitriliruptorales bacterium]|nr:hypothetical protein [Nitriliruptorales bacterium]
MTDRSDAPCGRARWSPRRQPSAWCTASATCPTSSASSWATTRRARRCSTTRSTRTGASTSPKRPRRSCRATSCGRAMCSRPSTTPTGRGRTPSCPATSVAERTCSPGPTRPTPSSRSAARTCRPRPASRPGRAARSTAVTTEASSTRCCWASLCCHWRPSSATVGAGSADRQRTARAHGAQAESGASVITAAERYPALTRPITVGGLVLRNRMVMSPMTTYGLPDADGSSNERHRAYYEARARSGLGLIRVESAMVHLSGKSWPHHLAVDDDRCIPELARLVRTIKRHGPPVVLQLHHGGRVAVEALSGTRPLAPSPLAASGHSVPMEMTLQDIEEMVEAFGQAARRAREAGFDGVELHIGTAYLLLSFISPAQNIRQDEYGRDFAGRMRFPLRIVDRIRELAGREYPIGARIVGSDYHDGGVDLSYGQQVARRLETAGLAYLDVSAGIGPNAIRDSPLTIGGGQGVFADFAAAVKSVVTIPVMSVGRYYSLATAEEAVASGKTDLVAFARALIADPELVTKSLRGEETTVVPCIGCQACHGGMTQALGVSCVLNPATGHEHEAGPRAAAEPRRVLVRGSGVPGLELARVAARRGHDVTVAAAGLPFGGLLALRARVPGAEEVARGTDYFERTLATLRVRIVDDVPAERFDVTVDARPGSPILPEIPGVSPAKIIPGEHVLAGRAGNEDLGERVAVVGPGIFAGETALYLAAAGKDVTLLAAGEQPMEDAHGLIAGTTALRFAAQGGRVITSATVHAATDGVLDIEVGGEHRQAGPFDCIVAAIGWDPPDGPEYVVADAWDAFAARLQVLKATRLARKI